MYSLIKASTEIIMRKSPSRALLTKTPLAMALGVYFLVLVLPVSKLFIAPDQNAGYPIADLFLISLLALASMLLMEFWFLNIYARQKFSLKEVFVLHVLFAAAPTIVYWGIYIITSFSGMGAVVSGVVEVTFGIYMLFAYHKAIVDIARISKSEAVTVILVRIVTPSVVNIAGIVLLLPAA
ncbi:MAG: hypothetical protein Q7S95_03275 [bacterium]|nr:hypothetical protein [bacterium]